MVVEGDKHQRQPGEAAASHEQERASKRAKNGSNLKSDDNQMDALLDQVWAHYQAFLESAADQYDDEIEHTDGKNMEGDYDELEEILQLLLSDNGASYQTPHLGTDARTSLSTLTTRRSLLPVLVSVVSNILADAAIAESLQSLNEGRDRLDLDEHLPTIQRHVTNALTYCPWNAAAWSMAANWGRLTQRLVWVENRGADVAHWYHYAATCAHHVRHVALELLDDDTVDVAVKEWLESLVLNQMVGAEFMVDDEESDIEEKDDEQVETSSELEYWSASSVEGTARFMAAMQLSVIGQHDLAKSHLQHFPVTHRLHPHLWRWGEEGNGTGTTNQQNDRNEMATKLPKETIKDPAMYRQQAKFCGSAQGGLLPQTLYQQLCSVFAPEAAYWQESGYAHRGYYSYFMDRPSSQQTPRNVLEDVVMNYVLPAVETHLGGPTADGICGFEWWIHTRPIQANLGHNLHFDTDEALLSQSQQITHPIASCVLYLTGGEKDENDDTGTGDGGGSTIVLDQTPESTEVAQVAWKAVPRDNQVLVFPGNLLHGVLPCPGKQPNVAVTEDNPKTETTPDVNSLWKAEPKNEGKDLPNKHRLTLLIGFWTRRVPDQMKQQRLYGPCGPLPPASEEHSWVQAITKGYGRKSIKKDSRSVERKAAIQLVSTPIARVSPVWEKLQPEMKNDSPPLQIPKAIDHRFFVTGAPQCFRDALFEGDEFDEMDQVDVADGDA
jgi:hypothetical protein